MVSNMARAFSRLMWLNVNVKNFLRIVVLGVLIVLDPPNFIFSEFGINIGFWGAFLVLENLF
jgi:hypothetical protein